MLAYNLCYLKILFESSTQNGTHIHAQEGSWDEMSMYLVQKSFIPLSDFDIICIQKRIGTLFSPQSY